MSFSFGFNIDRTKKAGGGYDADASTFFTAASITDTTQKSAVNQLVLDLKSYNIWTKMTALYPIVGGSAGSHAVNLKTPGTYNLTFATGWIHASTGMTPNGSSSYADTSFIPSVNGTLNSSHISYYSRTNSASNGQTLSANNALGTAGGTSMYLKTISAGSFYGNVDVYPNVLADYAGGLNADTRGFYITSRTASNSQKGYKNGGIIGTSTSSGNRTNRSLFLAATNKDNPVQVTEYGIYQCAFASIGDGLSDTEAANFYTAVQAYQTTLSRNV